jgi:hypothetical protein
MSEDPKDLIPALTVELEHYERYGMKERAAEVKKQLTALGAKAAPPAKRATKAKAKKSTKL